MRDVRSAKLQMLQEKSETSQEALVEPLVDLGQQ